MQPVPTKKDNFATTLQNFSMWIERKFEATLNALFQQFPSIVVTGPRQVGKTATVRRCFREASYVSLDLPSVAALAEMSAEGFLRGRGDLKGLTALKKEYGRDAVISAYIASRTPRPYPVSDSVRAVPGSFVASYLSSW